MIGKIRFTTHDLGGHEPGTPPERGEPADTHSHSIPVLRATTARKVWTDYFSKADGIIYMVDAVEKERFPESKKELDVRDAQPVCVCVSWRHDRLIHTPGTVPLSTPCAEAAPRGDAAVSANCGSWQQNRQARGC